MKKILFLILALVMCLSLCACASGGENEKNTAEEAKTTVEEVKKLTLDDIKAMSIIELSKLEMEDVNHLSAAELKIASQTFSEKKANITKEELREFINEFYLKEQPELAPLVEDIFLCLEFIDIGIAYREGEMNAEDLTDDIKAKWIKSMEDVKKFTSNNSIAIKTVLETNYDSYNNSNLVKAIKNARKPLLSYYPCDYEEENNRLAATGASFNSEPCKKSTIEAIIETPVFFAE